MNQIFKNLVIFLMANNHMGDVNHGLTMIRLFADITRDFPLFKFAWKFQLRNMLTFIHSSYNDSDHKYVKRFKLTNISKLLIILLKNLALKYGFLTAATAFDLASVDLIKLLDFDIAKIASCSSTDWPLLNKFILILKPIIISVGGTSIHDIDNVVSFFKHRNKLLAIMHCIGEYPTHQSRMLLNQITLLKLRYDIPTGFSTHLSPDYTWAVMMAVAKGATIFLKHVAVVTDHYQRNAYSATPCEIRNWLLAARQSYEMCGTTEGRYTPQLQLVKDLTQFKRGVFLNRNIKAGLMIGREDVYYAFPAIEKQILANDMSKYIKYKAISDIDIHQPLISTLTDKIDVKLKILKEVKGINELISKTNITIPPNTLLLLSHHDGIDNFYMIGLTMFTIVNNEYCKKILVSLPNQIHPLQYHLEKTETFIILYGSADI